MENRLIGTAQPVGLDCPRTDTEKKVAEQSALLKNCFYDLLMEDTDNLLMTCDRDGILLFLKTGLPVAFQMESISGKTVFDLYEASEARQLLKGIQAISSGEKNVTFETSMKLKDEKQWFYNLLGPISDASGKIIAVGVIGINITTHKENEEKIQHLIYHDSVTGLYNRVYLDNHLKKIKKSGEPFGIIVGDLNGLKSVNDTYGHKVGDKLLRKAAHLLQMVSKTGDIAARSGGDEFVIVTSNNNIQYAEELCQRIKWKFAKAATKSLPLSISLGYAVKSSNFVSVQEVFKEADARMYRNKLLSHKSLYGSLLSSLQNTLYEKSQETEEHAERIKILAVKMGKTLKLLPHEVDNLSLLATLHDIGKIAIPEEILFKAGPLSPSELKVIQTHSEIGYRIVCTNIHLKIVAEGILAHHERWDGNGYPRGLKGAKIPLIARIISIIDSYDAMTHNRVYRQAIDPSMALDEIAKESGSQFDPKLVQTFLKLFWDGLYQI